MVAEDGHAATRIGYAPGLYFQTLTAQYAGLGRVEIAQTRAGNSGLAATVILRTLEPARRRSVR